VQDWLNREGWTVAKMLAHVREIEATFIGACRSMDINSTTLLVPESAMRGRFLCFRTQQAGAIVSRLSKRNIIADHRGDRLRIGFGIYHTQDDALRLAAALH